MITFSDFDTFKDNLNSNDYDEIWAITRTMGKYEINSSNFSQVTSLAPSVKLFKYYLDCRKRKTWGKKTFETYANVFLKELATNKEARQDLNTLFYYGKSKNILILCHCQNEEFCHRSIIASLLFSVHIPVISTMNFDYSRKADLYHSLYNSFRCK